MLLIFKNDARSLARLVAMWFSFQEYVGTPVNSRPSLFRIDSVHRMDTSLPYALLVF
jgi:hypothetical protein